MEATRPPKPLFPTTKLYGVITQKTTTSILLFYGVWLFQSRGRNWWICADVTKSQERTTNENDVTLRRVTFKQKIWQHREIGGLLFESHNSPRQCRYKILYVPNFYYGGSLQSSWTHLITPSRNFVEVR
jgi:hypothetical protein